MPELNDLQKNVSSILGERSEKDSPLKRPYDGKLKPLRTYEGDLSEAITQRNVSMVDIALAEQNKKNKFPEQQTDLLKKQDWTEYKNKFFIFVGSILFILGFLTVLSIYYVGSRNPIVQTSEKSIINYTKSFNIDIASSNRISVINSIVSEKKSFNLPVNSILHLNLTKNENVVFAQDAIGFLAPSIPDSLLRNLDNEYMIGIYSFDTNEPFVILKLKDFGIGFAGMLKWENMIISDLGQIFGIENKINGYKFEDLAYKNKDLRVAKDMSGKTILLYSFLDRQTVVITSNEKIFNALLAKYMTSQLVR